MSTKSKIELSNEVPEYSEALKKALFELLESRGIKHAQGPAVAYFEVIRPDAGVTRHFYVPFGQYGPRAQIDDPMSGTIEELIPQAVGTFNKWLDEDHSLVWRIYPEVVRRKGGMLTAYWRCVQLQDDRDPAAVIIPPPQDLERPDAAPPIPLPTPAREAQRSTIEILKEMLEDAEAGNVTEIVMVGFLKTGDFVVLCSPTMSSTRQVGALEQAKFDALVAHRQDSERSHG